MTDPGKPALCKYRLRFRSAARGRRGEMDGNLKKREVAERKRERSGTEREGGVIFVVGATKGEQRSRV